ncbi:hypothetical protein [Xanthomonas sp. 3498]|uniref:hypothetical protein n=1 Tax=Xanthomonas sp. 3498 TaxID=2663863 RepID=UPI001617ACB3|nr:hypothetical protein [Xanthomonas sp. 3498]MBB5875864.1 hypothetical protein [Xanthomonas sp. 3498]
MKKVPMPDFKALLIDWKIDVLESLDGAIFTFLALPWAPGGEPQSAAPMAPVGLNEESIRRLHADLGELVALMDSRGRGSSAPSGSSPTH